MDAAKMFGSETRAGDEMDRTVRFYSDGRKKPQKSNPGRLSRVSSGIVGNSEVFPEDHEPWQKRILDPGSKIVLKWHYIFLISCLVALFLDPLYFYLPSVDNGNDTSCIKLDQSLSIVVTFFRTLTDLFYVLHMVIKFRTAYVAPSSRVFGRGELVMDPMKIAWRYLKSDFFVDFAAALPFPQIVIWFLLPAIRAQYNNNNLAFIVLIQYVPRLYLIFPLRYQIIQTTGAVKRNAWAAAGYNLLLYMIFSHVAGAVWYLLSVERQTECWISECKKENSIGCISKFLDCGLLSCEDRQAWANKTQVFSHCDANTFQYGIFANTLTTGAVSSDFISKYFFCLWWGLQSLSSYGQNLVTGTYLGETTFAIIIATLGLVLLAHLIGNMETYLQSLTVRLEEWRLKQRDTEEWMSHRQLPPDLRARVRCFVQYKWLATRGVNEEDILRALPSDLRRDIRRHLCLDLIRRVPFFSQMDDQLLDAICERLVSSLSTEGTYIVREGDPVTEMLFVIRGHLESSTTNGGRTGFFNSIILHPGDFCGEELLTWALLPKSTVNLPTSTRTLRTLVEVEAFALRAEDLKFVANQFHRLHSKKLQHIFRFYSHHWRTWAACFIQAAWRRFKRRKLNRDLSMRELSTFVSFSSSVNAESEHEESEKPSPETDSSQQTKNLEASKFAASTRMGAQKIKGIDMPKLQKPDEPDFSSDAF